MVIAPGCSSANAVLQAKRQVFLQQLDALPFQREPPVRAQLDARLQQTADALALALDEPVVEQTFGRRDAEVVRHVDDVDNQRPLDAAVAKDDVEIAEGCRVRRCTDTAGEDKCSRDQDPPLHGKRILG